LRRKHYLSLAFGIISDGTTERGDNVEGGGMLGVTWRKTKGYVYTVSLAAAAGDGE